ncbi:hypothetical protein I7I53_06997 [Histoplasma capsulatum var. duboisii H88]|uniref:Uncharacterized protein n=1 Tax=Ajellomyces capsulatus (strain H88) TaxID=544711 RepID=A0A8A1LDH1_AJEC8|nr:hypothetical protein I7I53_06997 [Histoplasma capsulatum var. duboisii H88]
MKPSSTFFLISISAQLPCIQGNGDAALLLSRELFTVATVVLSKTLPPPPIPNDSARVEKCLSAWSDFRSTDSATPFL